MKVRTLIMLGLTALALQAPVAAQDEPLPPGAIEIAPPRFSAEAFVKWMKSRNAGAKAVATFEAEWKGGADGRITDRAVRAIDHGYARAMALSDEGDPKGALELARVIAGEDKVVRAHARYFLARTLLDEDDPEGAVDLLSDFIREDRGLSYLDGEAAFYLGYSLSLVPQVDAAIINLRAFLKLYPDAAERYRANAQQLMQELEAQWQSPLHAIADDMKNCERKLKKEHAGDKVQTKQLDIVEKLQQLIEELEKRQQGGGGAPSGNNIPSGPANSSSLPGGEGRVGSLHGSRGVKDRWGSMPDRDRQKILNDLQTKLPERYRSLLENYYKRCNEGGKN